MDFKEQIEQRLKGLSKKQQCHFSWLCGLRALPFLSIHKGFTYWPEDVRQKNLYSIFYALDISAQAAFLDYSNVDVVFSVAVSAAIAAIDAAEAAVAADAAANAANIASSTIATTNTVFTATIPSSFVAIVTDASFTYLQNLLFKDIEAIKKNELNVCNHNISVYGELWENFQEDLKANGCAYWAQFLENLFNNSFKINKEQLKRHLGVPDEIKEKGAAAVGRYLEKLGDEVEQLNEARIIILGEKGAGKTSLARRLLDINAEMPKDRESTEGVDRHLWNFLDKDNVNYVNAHIWDFAGHSITHSAHRCFMTARCLYIYVYNGRIERDNDPTYWLEQIQLHGGKESPILFLINEKDDHLADIPERVFKDEYPSIAGYYRVDIGNKDKTKLQNFRQIVMHMVRNNPSWNKQIVSAKTYKIKSRLQEYFIKTKEPHITREQFDKIAKGCGVQDEQIDGILEDLKTLGICLWYNIEDMEDFNTLVLNPDWITHGIYRIINKGHKDREHILTVLKGTEILKNDERYEYPRDKVAFLFKLMKVYELAYFKNTDRIFIPGILVLDRPDGLPSFDDPNERLTMIFSVEKALPPSIAARIMVQRHEEIFDEKLLWRKGAVLKYKDGDAIALIVEHPRSVTVRVKGVDKTPYIASLRETIKSIFKDYEVTKSNFEYEVLMPEEAKPSESIRLSKERAEPLLLLENVIRDFVRLNQNYPHGNILLPLGVTIQMYDINISGNLGVLQTGKENIADDHSTNVKNSTLTNSPVTGTMINSTQTITVNKPEIKDWLHKVIEELEKNNVKNDSLTDAIGTLQDIIQTPNPKENTVKHVVEMIKTIGINIISSAIWQDLMANLPIK